MKPKILVVENDTMSRELARRVLHAGGYDVTCASDAEEALRIAPALRPDLVLMDLGLPGMDGIEATRRLRADRATAGTPVAVLSAQAFGPQTQRARRAGCVDYLTKPIGARELLDRVGSLIGAHPAIAPSRLKERRAVPSTRTAGRFR